MELLKKERKNQLIALLKQVGAIKFGEFTLKDGTTSLVYIDLRVLPNFPSEFEKTVELAADYLCETKFFKEIDGFIAPPLAGVPLAVGLGLKLKKSCYLARTASKDYGTKKMIEGNVLGKKLVIIDDVITSGGSKIPLIQKIRDLGGRVQYLFVFVNRMPKEELEAFETQNDVLLHSLLNLDDLIN